MNRCSIKKLFLKILQYSKSCKILQIFFNENVGLQSCNFFKKRLQHRCFPVNIAKFLRTPVLKNICQRLFERFRTQINNITSNTWSEEDIFSNKRQKNHYKIQLDEKLSFSWCSRSFRFSQFLQCMLGGVCPT